MPLLKMVGQLRTFSLKTLKLPTFDTGRTGSTVLPVSKFEERARILAPVFLNAHEQVQKDMASKESLYFLAGLRADFL